MFRLHNRSLFLFLNEIQLLPDFFGVVTAFIFFSLVYSNSLVFSDFQLTFGIMALYKQLEILLYQHS